MRGDNAMTSCETLSRTTLDVLVAGLAPIDMAQPRFEPPEVAAYRRYYNLDLPAQYPGLEHRLGRLTVQGERISVQVFKPLAPVGTAIVCHGYYDHVGIYGHVIRFLLDRNLCVLSFDQPGHGLSSGPRADIESFDQYVDTLDACLTQTGEHLPKPWHLLGQSMGGAVAVEFLVQNRRPANTFANVILLAPLVRPALWPINRVVYELARRFITERPRVIVENSGDPEFVEFLRNDPLQPMVLPVRWVTAMVRWMARVPDYPPQPMPLKIVQGDRDGTVDYKYSLKALARSFEIDVCHIAEARHHLANESEPIRTQMWQWLDARCQWSG